MQLKKINLKGNILALVKMEAFNMKQVVSVYVECPAELIEDYEYIDVYKRDCSELMWEQSDIKIPYPDEYYVINANGDKKEGNGKIKEIIEVFSDDLEYDD